MARADRGQRSESGQSASGRARIRKERGRMTGSYSFLAWARQGLANRITGAGALRASVPVQLKLGVHQLDGADVERALPPRTVELYGPSDILALDSRAIIRTEPRAFITNFEPNYLAAIEFYDEDLPW